MTTNRSTQRVDEKRTANGAVLNTSPFTLFYVLVILNSAMGGLPSQLGQDLVGVFAQQWCPPGRRARGAVEVDRARDLGNRPTQFRDFDDCTRGSRLRDPLVRRRPC